MYPKITDELLAKHFAKETSELENKTIQLWLMENNHNQQHYDELYLAWTSPINTPKPLFDKEKVYERINTAIVDEKRNTKQLQKRQYLKFAASIVLFIALASSWLIFSNPEPEMISASTEYGQKMKIKLPDGSLVHLNSGSVIKYPEKFNEDTRTIHLIGEAFFDVKKNPDKPFIVETTLLQTSVLGTSFNINAYQDSNPSITVNSGSVQVSSLTDSLVLKPNQQALLESEHLLVKNVDASQEILWKEGILKFQDTPMLTVKTQLEKWYNVQIEFEDESIENCVFTGQFKNEKLLIVLEVFRETFSISYEIKSKQIIIKGKGC